MWKKMILKVKKNSQENTCVGVSFMIKLQARVFRWILLNFEEHIFTNHLLVTASVEKKLKIRLNSLNNRSKIWGWSVSFESFRSGVKITCGSRFLYCTRTSYEWINEFLIIWVNESLTAWHVCLFFPAGYREGDYGVEKYVK